MLANLTDLTDSAYGALVLGVVLGSIKCTLLEGGTAVDGCVTGGTDFKLSELIKLDFDGIVRIPFALSLCLLGLPN